MMMIRLKKTHRMLLVYDIYNKLFHSKCTPKKAIETNQYPKVEWHKEPQSQNKTHSYYSSSPSPHYPQPPPPTQLSDSNSPHLSVSISLPLLPFLFLFPFFLVLGLSLMDRGERIHHRRREIGRGFGWLFGNRRVGRWKVVDGEPCLRFYQIAKYEISCGGFVTNDTSHNR